MKILRSVLIIGLLFTNSVFSQNSCTTPITKEQGLCVPWRNCEYITSIVLNAPRPIPANVQQHIQLFSCGKIDNKNHVCCAARQLSSGSETVTFATTTAKSGSTNKSLSLINLPNCGVNNKNKIAHGVNASLSEFPWMALLEYKNMKFLCGGSLISARYVLTAAHCVGGSKNSELVSVRLGEHDLSSERDCELFGTLPYCADPVENIPVEKIIIHPDFKRRGIQNDIALIRLNREVDLNGKTQHIRSICLPTTSALQQTSLKRIIAAGWGLTENSSQSAILQKAIIPVNELDVCQRLYTSVEFTSSQLCAGGEANVQTCKGDSGSPLFFSVRFKGARFMQFGLVSAGSESCGGPNNYPGVYTSIASYMDWILENIEP